MFLINFRKIHLSFNILRSVCWESQNRSWGTEKFLSTYSKVKALPFQPPEFWWATTETTSGQNVFYFWVFYHILLGVKYGKLLRRYPFLLERLMALLLVMTCVSSVRILFSSLQQYDENFEFRGLSKVYCRRQITSSRGGLTCPKKLSEIGMK